MDDLTLTRLNELRHDIDVLNSWVNSFELMSEGYISSYGEPLCIQFGSLNSTVIRKDVGALLSEALKSKINTLEMEYREL